MKRTLMILIAAITTFFRYSPSIPQQLISNGCSSAGVINQPVWFNCDFADTAGMQVTLKYREQSDVNFNSVQMNLTGEIPRYAITYVASAIFTSTPGVLEYYFVALRDSTMVTQSPKNSNDQFPPSLYKFANFVPDPSGDMAPGSAGNWLDLIGCGATYSDSRIYCYLQNVSGTWPLNQLFTYFAYTFGFLITDGADSSYYALVYANIPLMLSTGLYVLDLSDSSYTRIGDISSGISGGRLFMACDYSTFVADPGWPGWPPPDGYIVPMAATLTASLSGQFANDFTYPAIYQPQTKYLDFATNNPPALFMPRLELNPGVSITPSVRYFDLDGNLPTVRRFLFGYELVFPGSFDHSYSDSADFEGIISWPPDGWYRYYFVFSDGHDTVRTATDSILIGSSQCSYLPGDINGDGSRIGGDVTYGVRYFKGIGPQPPDSCYLDSTGSYLYVSGDVNGNCEFRGSDITRLVQFFKGMSTLSFCHFFPPGR